MKSVNVKQVNHTSNAIIKQKKNVNKCDVRYIEGRTKRKTAKCAVTQCSIENCGASPSHFPLPLLLPFSIFGAIGNYEANDIHTQ